ncbi:MAG: hypothetical protein HC897_16695, partial [Thermoanaerobaculia bacterium]|nr:hypothetical protein [Thermoanaerobaculia bacterium]
FEGRRGRRLAARGDDPARRNLRRLRHHRAHRRSAPDGVCPRGARTPRRGDGRRARKDPGRRRVRFAGSVIVRQRPGTAKGLLFITLEDETGMAQAVVAPDLFQEHRQLIAGSPGLVIEGILQRRDGSTSIKAEKFWTVDRLAETPSHDFR